MSNVDGALRKRSNVALRSPTPYQLRALVLDYLSHHCYIETAKAFIEDSTVKELDADGDEVMNEYGSRNSQSSLSSSSSSTLSGSRLRRVEQRKEIRELILAGQIEEAIDALNQYFPSVLAADPHSSSNSFSSPTTTIGVPGPNIRAGLQHSRLNSVYTYASPTSVEPSHLLLNLRLLAFIEASRTRPPERRSATKVLVTPQAQDSTTTTPDDDEDPSRAESPTWTDPNEGAEMSAEKQDLLISKARKLSALVESLPNPRDREVYSKELKNTVGLLGYKIPERCDISKYLSYERREAVAEQINRAVLHRCGLPPVSQVELAARYTTAVWSAANQHGVKPRAGIIVPPQARTKGERSEGESQELATFDLKQFLDLR